MNQKRNASAFCNYNETFTQYDQNRQPNGLQELLQIFGQNRIPVSQQTVLEGGFGTGSYINHIRQHAKAVYGVEGSEQGYKETGHKIGAAENVYLQMGNILDLSFADNFFDVYMVNQVLHHLDTEHTYPNLTQFLKESWRVLKPGGVLTINTCSQEQLDPHAGVYWNYKYLEKAARALQKRYISVDALISRLEKLNFTDIRTTIPSGRLFQQRYYRDPELIVEPAFLKADSLYCFLSEAEIRETTASIRSAIDDGSAYRHMQDVAERVDKMGEAIIISAHKPLWLKAT